MAMIQVAGLSRLFRDGRDTVTALDDVDLVVSEGETLGLLGPNGAGKTTLVRILTTLLLPSAGTAGVAGYDVVRERKSAARQVGLVLGGDRGLYGRLSARQNLHYWAALCHLGRRSARDRVEFLLEELGLATRAHEPVEGFSRGMLQRVHLARALVANPPVLVLDEPTNGLDPHAATAFRALITRLQAEGKTILLTTHDMNEAEAICSRVAFIDRGRIVGLGHPNELRELLQRSQIVTASHVTAAALRRLREMAGIELKATDREGDVTVAVLAAGAMTAVLVALSEGGARDITTRPPQLADVYRHVIANREFGV
jgi:ABC-2 type transport system ATP-binding protein